MEGQLSQKITNSHLKQVLLNYMFYKPDLTDSLRFVHSHHTTCVMLSALLNNIYFHDTDHTTLLKKKKASCCCTVLQLIQSAEVCCHLALFTLFTLFTQLTSSLPLSSGTYPLPFLQAVHPCICLQLGHYAQS